MEFLMQKGKTSGTRESIKTALYAAAIAIFVRTFAYEPFNIPSGSMKPTLLVGDYLFVSKFSFGYSRHSLPFSLPLIAGRVFYAEPERGDVAVFKLPSDNKTDYIKRIVGLPGDKIQLRNGIVHVNGVAVGRRRVEDFIAENGAGVLHRIPRFIETLPGGREHAILEVSDRGPGDNTRVYTVPSSHFFAMGDNRDNSRDSRFPNVGFVPKENLVGRAEFLFFSIDGPVWKVWNWFSSIRFSRLFSGIE
jgi:signal peptidase I